MTRGTCATCAFLHTVNNECRFNPPTVVALTSSDNKYHVPIDVIRSHWPKVDANDWCSRWYPAIKDGRRKSYNHMVNDGDVTFLDSTTEQTKES